MNKVTIYLKEKVLTRIIQYTIGLILPWWVIDLINRQIVNGYDSQFLNYKKIYRYTVGLILPWWILNILQGNQTSISTREVNSGGERSSATTNVKMKNFYCIKCGMLVQEKQLPAGKYGRCTGSSASNSAHQWRDYGYAGEYTSSCEKCGVTLNHKTSSMFSCDCIQGGVHKWHRVYN